MLRLFAPKVSLKIEELPDFLDSNSDNILGKINRRTEEFMNKNSRLIEHIYYVLGTISPYNINAEKIDEHDLAIIKIKTAEIETRVKELTKIIKEEPNHLLLLEQIKVFEDRFEGVSSDIKEPIKKIEIYFKDMIPVLITKLHELRNNLLEMKVTLDDKLIQNYYELYFKLDNLKEKVVISDESKKKKLQYSKDIVKHKTRLNELQSKKESMSYTESFKMSEKTYKDHKEVSDKIQVERKVVEELFNDIIPLFKAYNSKFYERVVDNYIQSPADALINDHELSIEKHIKKIDKMIREDKIKISKNNDKILKSLDKIKKTHLKTIRNKLETLASDLNRKKILLSKNKVMLDIIEVDYQIDNVLSKISKIESDIGFDEDVNYDNEIKILINDLGKFTGKRIIVT